ncbi:IPT/TIG domain-containing protein [Actinoplanes auranticolor]|uniref:IPT/TIG domain-containing protein n=1 Tax=Actinoplanes auranticolor TaxID=47988 RepID=UPI001BB434FE|nr:IPT/TIG domain-containing protein [Actinoplanes auranticolor]
MRRNGPRHGSSLLTAQRMAALKRLTPYLVTFLAVTVLLLAGFIRAQDAESNRTAASVVPPSVGSSAVLRDRPSPPGPSAAPRAVDPGAPTTTATGPEPTAVRPPATAAKRAPRIIAWIRDLGLTGGGGSYQEAFVAELSWGQCAELLRDVESASREEVDHTTRDLYRAAAQACLAAFHGKRALWPAADAAVEQLSGRSAALDCIDRSVYELTRALVRIHRSDPDAVLRRGRADEADGPDCPRLRSVEPGSGPAAGGYEVRLVGEHLPDPAVVHFGEVTRTVRTSGGRFAVVTVPPMGKYKGVSVWIEGWPYEVMHSPTFSYDPPADGTGQSHGP